MKTDETSYSLSFYYNPSDEHIEEILEALCLTESKEIELIKGYSVRKDHNNPYPIQNHLHLFKNGKQILSMNQDGSAHDGMSGRIPNSIKDKLKAICPDYEFPDNRLVESVEFSTTRLLYTTLMQLADVLTKN